MKKTLLIGVLAWVVALPAYGAKPTLQQGLKLYQRHHYREAAHLLHSQLGNSDTSQEAALQLSFGMASLANARCYDQLYQAALAVQHDYLKHLVAAQQPKESRSRLAGFYLAKAHLASGDFKAAATGLERFLTYADTPEDARIEARVTLGTVYHLLGRSKKSQTTWSTVPSQSPIARTFLAAAYQRTGQTRQQPAQMADAALSELTASGNKLAVQCAGSLLGISNQTGQVAQGFKILNHTNLQAFAHEEVLAANKTIRFYDPTLLRHLADFYNLAAIQALQKAMAAKQAKTRSAAVYYLGEAYDQAGQSQAAVDAFSQFLANHPQPKSIKQRARVQQAALKMRLNPPTDPPASLQPFIRPDAGPALISDVVLACSELQIDCPPEAVKRASALWQQSQGRPPVNLSLALGRHYRQQAQYAKALVHLEGGRDKSRKNRIETNPPVMLIELARAYYHSRQFSEALEIYFEMSKQFPAVRQIQVAIQGIYAMEEQSAGDAKIF